jgi:transglutaminase-like putative cysteine protease
LTIFSCRVAAGDDIYIHGTHSVKYSIKLSEKSTDPVLFKNYFNNGYSQQITPGDENSFNAEISVGCDDFNSEIPYPVRYNMPSWLKPFVQPGLDIQSDSPEIINRAKQIVKGSRYQYEAVQKILRWVNSNITYDLDLKGPKTATDVLQGKKGYCVGYSNLATALLRAAGIPCRNVHGIHINGDSIMSSGEYQPLSLKGITLHRWIEIYYPDVGWIFSDPKYSVNFIGANYIFLAHQDDRNDFPAASLEGLMIKTERNFPNFAYIDRVQDGSGQLLIRPSIFTREKGFVGVWIMNREISLKKTEVVIASLDRVLKLPPDDDGKVSFIGLDGGEYELKIRYNGKLVYVNKFGLKDKQELNFDIKLRIEETRDEGL